MKYRTIPIDKIKVPPDRIRGKDFDITDLVESIKNHGLYQPIVVRQNPDSAPAFILAAGERRLRACIQLGYDKIPAVLFSDLSPLAARRVEIEENLKRKDPDWRATALGIGLFHSEATAQNPEWTRSDTANELSISPASITRYLDVVQALQEKTIDLSGAETLQAAYNIVSRRTQRVIASAMAELDSIMLDPEEPKTQAQDQSQTQSTSKTPASSPAPAPAPSFQIILNDFHTFAKTPQVKKFNFLHCDFPYGIDMNQSGRNQVSAADAYEDSPDVYWQLLDTLCNEYKNFLYPSAHFMFWCSPKFREQTRLRLKDAGFWVAPVDIIWHKTDNAGIIPDSFRQGRQTYETCLYGSLGDRKIIRPVSLSYGAPTAPKDLHPSIKPEPVLAHFFRMFVDDLTEILDPTCGSGSSLRAALRLKASRGIGLEVLEKYQIPSASALSAAIKLYSQETL